MKDQSDFSVCIIGGALMDIMGFPESQLVSMDSTPGHLKLAPGGVGRNIAENLVRLNINTRFISAFGDDVFSELLLKQAADIGLDTSASCIVTNQIGAVHLAIQDHHNDLSAGIAAMKILQELTPEFLTSRLPVFHMVDLAVVETNIPEESIDFLLKNLNGKRIALDPVSVPMAQKARHHVGRFQLLKANRQEAEVLCQKKIHDKNTLRDAVLYFHQEGLEQVFITLGSEGAFFSDGQSAGMVQSPPMIARNTTGAGDAFMAGVIFAQSHKYPVREAALMGMACAAIAIQNENAVNPALNSELLLEKFNNL